MAYLALFAPSISSSVTDVYNVGARIIAKLGSADPGTMFILMFGGAIILSVFLIIRITGRRRTAKIIQQDEITKAEESKAEPTPSKPLEQAVKIALLSEYDVIEFEGRHYFTCNNGMYACRVHGSQNKNGDERRSQQDKEDDVWHFFGALALYDFITDSDFDSPEHNKANLARIKLFAAGFLDIPNAKLSLMPDTLLDAVSFDAVDSSAYSAEIINSDIVTDVADVATKN